MTMAIGPLRMAVTIALIVLVFPQNNELMDPLQYSFALMRPSTHISRSINHRTQHTT